MEMETNNDNTDKRKGDAPEQGDSRAKRLKCSIEADAFCCDVCTKPLGPPIFQCTEGHLFCSSCHDKLPEGKCTFSSGCTGTVTHSLGMDVTVQSILIDCCHAEHGCTQKTTYYNKKKHELLCPHAPCKCPEPSCCFAWKVVAELQDHLTGHHQWPLISFQYWVPFDLRVVEPGSHILHCRNDGQLFILSVQPAAEPNGLAVSLVCVQYTEPTGCSVSFSLSTQHRSTSTLAVLSPWWHSGWPPTEYICHVPRVSNGPEDAGIVFTINITHVAAADENDDPDDSSYVEGDEEDYVVVDEEEDGSSS